MTICGIDPGPEESAFVVWDGKAILEFGNESNGSILDRLTMRGYSVPLATYIAIEQIRGFGVMASNALFDSCMWSGRFLQAFGEKNTFWIPRKEAAANICGRGGISKDQFVREALIARFGGKERGIGNKRQPGPLYGVAGHVWAALAIAITCWELRQITAPEL